MNKSTLNAPTNSPDGDPTLVPSNSASEGEGITRTDKGNFSELSSNITCIEIQSSRFIASIACTSSPMNHVVLSRLGMLLQA